MDSLENVTSVRMVLRPAPSSVITLTTRIDDDETRWIQVATDDDIIVSVMIPNDCSSTLLIDRKCGGLK